MVDPARGVAEARGDLIALVSDEGTLTYAELDLAVRKMAAVFRNAGIHHGERVAFVIAETPLAARNAAELMVAHGRRAGGEGPHTALRSP